METFNEHNEENESYNYEEKYLKFREATDQRVVNINNSIRREHLQFIQARSQGRVCEYPDSIRFFLTNKDIERASKGDFSRIDQLIIDAKKNLAHVYDYMHSYESQVQRVIHNFYDLYDQEIIKAIEILEPSYVAIMKDEELKAMRQLAFTNFQAVLDLRKGADLCYKIIEKLEEFKAMFYGELFYSENLDYRVQFVNNQLYKNYIEIINSVRNKREFLIIEDFCVVDKDVEDALWSEDFSRVNRLVEISLMNSRKLENKIINYKQRMTLNLRIEYTEDLAKIIKEVDFVEGEKQKEDLMEKIDNIYDFEKRILLYERIGNILKGFKSLVKDF
jgi:hypothetical protein